MTIKLYALTLTFVFATVGLGSAQQLVKDVSSTADLTPQQTQQIELLRSLPSSENVTIVDVDPSQLKAQSDVAISLSQDVTVGLANTSRTDIAADKFVWSGESNAALAMGNVDEGTATISVNKDQISASIRTADGVYRIQPLPGGLHALIKVKSSSFPSEHPLQQDQSTNRDVNPAELRKPDNNDVATVDILVLATTETANYIGSVEQFSQLAIQLSNESFVNSDVRLRFRLAGTATLKYKESGDYETDVTRLSTPGDGYLDEVQGLRDTAKADLTILLSSDPSYCGLAKEIYASAKSAFAAVNFSCAIDNLSFPHEIGHLLGACHNPEVNSACAPFADGHGFINTFERVRTIMAYDCPGGCIRQPQWSRPPLWGIPNLSFDARVLDATGPRAALFR